MNTVDDLRQLLESDAGRAPGPDGVVAAAERGAARIRRRRRVSAVAGAGVLVAVVALVAPVVADRRQADRPLPASTPAERRPVQVTLGVDPAAGYVLTSRDIDANGQWIRFRVPLVARGEARPAGAIAFDPEAGFDPGRLQQGERTTVSGHEAWYVSDYPLGGYVLGSASKLHRSRADTPLLGWRDPGGAWVLVFQDDREDPGRVKLHQAAQAVRVHPADDLTLPLSLGPLPAGLPMNLVQTDGRTSARITLGGTPAPLDAKWLMGPGPYTGVMIEAGPGTEIKLPATRVARVAGHDAWYSRTTIGTARGNGTLWVRVAGCTVTFSAWDAELASAAQLREIAAGATYADCADPDTWGPAVRR